MSVLDVSVPDDDRSSDEECGKTDRKASEKGASSPGSGATSSEAVG